MGQRVRKLSGVASLRDMAAGTTMANAVEIEVRDGEATRRIGKLGDRRSTVTVSSTHPAVVRYEHQVLDAHKVHEYRLSPPRAVPKPTPVRKQPTPQPRMIPCPACDGSGYTSGDAEDLSCKNCKGQKRVRTS